MRLSLFLALLALPGVKSSDDSDYQRRCEENERRRQECYNEARRRDEEREREMERERERREEREKKEAMRQLNE